MSIKEDPTFRIDVIKEENVEEFIKYANQIGGESRFLTYGEGEFPMGLERMKKQIKNFQESETDLLICAFIENQLIGTANVSTPDNKIKQHNANFGISIRKKYWGRGIGSALMQFIIEWVETQKMIRKITFEVFVDNVRAINLYEKFGFQKEGHIRRTFFINDEFRDTYIMGRLFN